MCAEARKYCQKKYGGAGDSIARVQLCPAANQMLGLWLGDPDAPQ